MGALYCRSLKCMKLLIKAGADVNVKGTGIAPLMFAVLQGGYTNFIKILLETGAIPNIPDDLGWLPVEHAASRDCREEAEMLFPLNSPIPNVPNWSVDGIISHAKVKHTKLTDQHQKESRKSVLKAHADLAFRQKNYDCAAKVYDLVGVMPDDLPPDNVILVVALFHRQIEFVNDFLSTYINISRTFPNICKIHSKTYR